MTLNRKIRIVHYWLSFLVAVPLLIVIVTGGMLMLKKQVAWIQPPTIEQSPITSHQDLNRMVNALKRHHIKVDDLSDIKRIDVLPAKGIAKITLTHSPLEVQLRLVDYEVLHTQIRRSDTIESIHDGSYFGSFVKYGVFLVAAFILLAQLLTGLYLVFITEKVRQSKKRPKGILHEN